MTWLLMRHNEASVGQAQDQLFEDNGPVLFFNALVLLMVSTEHQEEWQLLAQHSFS